MSEKPSKLKIIIPVIILVPVIAIVLLMSNLEKAASKILSKALNTDVTVGKIDLDLLEGKKISISVSDITMRNMPGYTDQHIMTIASVKAQGGIADDKSVALDNVAMDGLNIHFEINSKGTNIKDMLDNIKQSHGNKSKQNKADTTQKEKRDISIKKTSFTNGKIHARLMGAEKTIDLPSQTIYDIGTQENKVSYQAAAQQFIGQIMANAGNAATKIAINIDKDKIKGDIKNNLKEGLGGLLK